MWEYRAALLSITDGDGLRVLADTGFGGRHQVDLRLAGVYAPELNTPGGIETLEFVHQWTAELAAVKWPLLILTQPVKSAEPTERRSFARYIADVWDAHQPRNLNVELRGWLATHPEWGPGNT